MARRSVVCLPLNQARTHILVLQWADIEETEGTLELHLG